MTLSFTLQEDDYLQSMLFLASRSKPVNNGLRRSRITLTVCFLFFFILSYTSGTDVIATVVLAACVVGFWIGYPIVHKALYKRMARKTVKALYSEQFGRSSQLSLMDNGIVWHDLGGDAETPWTAIEGLYELPRHFFLHSKDGAAIGIPRQAVDAAAVSQQLKQIGAAQSIPYLEQPKWKW